ncbi:1-acyl-sn-glycerol-3-phosphate acyltransferase [Caloramator mitchellensis]|uniref:1-acyl-sn-glycerol-3-phosphate acyltransferase n=1 Tax=Caloramator mitchellensis TaxID=908809 RepID=A0A0R3K4Y6_CALMK|nr:lysophospholipid acyltransferase family protein [Caloramator mitchellensis]KRQ88002.1 1-acyl-sn-glycerol-3-phosphate acyltransferase [Caloramator mitchellensis]
MKNIVGSILFSLPPEIYRPLCKFIVKRTVHKYANIKVFNKEIIKGIKSPVIFIANHLSNSDGIIINEVLEDFNPFFVAGVKLQSKALSRIGVEALNTITIHPSSADIEAIKKSIKVIKEGHSLMIFPEGTRSRSGKMIEGKKGVVLIAKKCDVPIVPIGLYGTEKLMPINDEDMGSEKFYKADVYVNFGEPFKLPEKTEDMNKDEYEEYCLNLMMKKIAELIPEEYRGVYR